MTSHVPLKDVVRHVTDVQILRAIRREEIELIGPTLTMRQPVLGLWRGCS